ncbi:MAK10-like protein [Tanacetum coccineum]
MGDANPIRTLGDYSRPSHEGYRNTIELPEGNNVVPLRSDTIRLVQNGCSFHGLRSEDPNQHLKDFLKLVDSLDLDVANRERTCLLGRTAKLRNDVLMFQQHQGESLSECEIDRAAGGKLRDKNADESWEIIENLALYDHEGWNDTSNPVKSVKAIFMPQGTSKTPDRRLFEIEDQINFLLKGSRPTPKSSSTHVPQAYAEAVYSDPRPRNLNELPKENPFTFRERTSPNPQPQALGTTFVARVRNYIAAHTERMKWFENANFKQQEEINDRMAEMSGLLKELTTIKEAEMENETKNRIKNEPIRKARKEETTEAPSSQPIEYYLKHRINEKLIEGLVDNHSNPEKEDNKKEGHQRKLQNTFHSYIYPLGIAEDVLVEVTEHVYPVDFMILDIKEDERRPFILGTPFLTTAKAVIKFYKGTITLRSGKTYSPTMTVNRLVLELEEKIKLHQEEEMEFERWRNKNFKNERPAHVKIEDEVDDEGEVT